jgi:aminopeptidase N
MSIDPKSGIKKQDSYYVISGVAKNKVGRDMTWNWLRYNWKAIQVTSGFLAATANLIVNRQ